MTKREQRAALAAAIQGCGTAADVAARLGVCVATARRRAVAVGLALPTAKRGRTALPCLAGQDSPGHTRSQCSECKRIYMERALRRRKREMRAAVKAVRASHV